MANGASGARFAPGKAVWVRLLIGLGVQYDFVAWVVRVLSPSAAGQPSRYLDVEEAWLSISRPPASPLGDGR